MAKAENDIELDDDFIAEDEDTPETDTPNSKASLTRRRQIDNLLEERRLRKQLSEFDFDLD